MLHAFQSLSRVAFCCFDTGWLIDRGVQVEGFG